MEAEQMTAPVDGDLRDALAKRLAEHPEAFQSDGDYGERQWIECSCGSDDTYVDDTEYVDDSVWRSGYVKHVADALLPTIAAHVQAEKAKAYDQGAVGQYAFSKGLQTQLHNPYREARDE